MVQSQNDGDFAGLQLVQRVVDPVRRPMDNGGDYIVVVEDTAIPKDEV